MHNLVNNRVESVNDRMLSVPLTPRATFAPRLTLETCKAAGYNVSQQDVWYGAQGDDELKHRASMIHRYLCALPMGEFTEVLERLLRAQEKGLR
jgi:hypothetical protein